MELVIFAFMIMIAIWLECFGLLEFRALSAPCIIVGSLLGYVGIYFKWWDGLLALMAMMFTTINILLYTKSKLETELEPMRKRKAQERHLKNLGRD